MKKLICLLLALLCLAALTTTAFADLIFPPEEGTGETYEFTADSTSPSLSAEDLAAARSETVPATEAPAESSAGASNPIALYLGIGAAALGAALVLFFLLRKKPA